MNNSTFGKVLGKGGKFYDEVSSPETFGNIENIKAIAVVDGKPSTTTDYEKFTPIVPDQLEQDVETLKTDVEELGNEQNQTANDLTNEITAREQADTALQSDINTRAKLDGSNLNDDNVASWNTKLLNKPTLTLTTFSGTLKEFGTEVRNNYKTKNIVFRIGNLDNSTIKNIIPQPEGYANYTTCYINSINIADEYNYIIEILAIGIYINKSSRRFLIVTGNTQGTTETLTDWVLINTENNAINFAEEERQKSKNLFNINKISNSSSITIQNNELTCNYWYSETKETFAELANLEIGKTYVISFNTTSTRKYIYFTNKKGYTREFYSGVPFVVNAEMLESVLVFYSIDSSNSSPSVYTDIMIEEGSVATDYQPYNGAIVHEKDLHDVEHVEVIYDKDSTDPNINQGKTSGVTFGNEGNVIQNMIGYKRYRFYAYIYNQVVIFESDGRKPTSYAGCYFANTSRSVFSIVVVPFDGNTARPQYANYYAQGWNSLENNENVYIFKMEGIL